MMVRRVFQGAVIHALIAWAALAVSYNSYKELMRGSAPLERAVKDSIKGTFPWAALLFVLIYTALFALARRTAILLRPRSYIYAAAVYAVSVNILFSGKGKAVLTVLNASAAVLALVLVAVSGAAAVYGSRGSFYARLKPYAGKAGEARGWVQENLSLSLVAASATLIFICGVLLTFKDGNTARSTAQYAFFALAAGVIMELYGVIRGKGKS